MRGGRCIRAFTRWVCSCARCSCVVVTLARLGVTIFVSWLGVRCGAVTRPGLARHFLHHSAGPLPLQSRWFIRACCSSGGSLEHAPVGKLFPNGHPDCSDEGAYTRTGGAPHSGNNLSRVQLGIHTHRRGSLYCQQAFGCPAGMPCAGKGPQVPRRHRSEGTDLLRSAPRADDSPNALRSPQRSSTGGRESRGHQRRPGRFVQQRTMPPSRPLKRCIDVLCQFLSGGQGARARSDAWVLDSVFFVTASTVVG